VSTLSDLLAEHTLLSGAAVAHLQRLVSEWQLLADLSFSDLTLWVPVTAGGARRSAESGQELTPQRTDRFLCVAQVRPTTGATAWLDDLVAGQVPARMHAVAQRAWETGAIALEGRVDLAGGPSVRRAVVPVRHGDQLVAVMSRDSIIEPDRVASRLETVYIDIAEDLFQMVADGTFPEPEQPQEILTGPRAGDGLLRLDEQGIVTYVSPNALSAYHRIGMRESLVGLHLATETRALVNDPFDAEELANRITAAVHGQSSLRMEIEVGAATVLFRSLPLQPQGKLAGAFVLVRDVTEVRRRDRAILSKDATIREIHHRVKNNLQTVAALLRLQARRSGLEEVKRALDQSTRRVATIAMVHETLSTSADDRVDLDQIVDRLVPMIADVSAAESSVRIRRIGSFGVLNTELATPLIMVLAEIVQNAVQHGYPANHPGGQVIIEVERSAKSLNVVVSDDGRGIPDGFSLDRSTGLGLEIVRTLVNAELRGYISMQRRYEATGTDVRLEIPLRSRA